MRHAKATSALAAILLAACLAIPAASCLPAEAEPLEVTYYYLPG